MSFNEAKITRVLYQNLLKLTVWHNALTDTPEPGTYTVIVSWFDSSHLQMMRERLASDSPERRALHEWLGNRSSGA